MGGDCNTASHERSLSVALCGLATRLYASFSAAALQKRAIIAVDKENGTPSRQRARLVAFTDTPKRRGLKKTQFFGFHVPFPCPFPLLMSHLCCFARESVGKACPPPLVSRARAGSKLLFGLGGAATE